MALRPHETGYRRVQRPAPECPCCGADPRQPDHRRGCPELAAAPATRRHQENNA